MGLKMKNFNFLGLLKNPIFYFFKINIEEGDYLKWGRAWPVCRCKGVWYGEGLGKKVRGRCDTPMHTML